METLIFVVEDDTNIRDLIKVAFESYKYKVEAFENAEDCLARLNEVVPEVCIFDIMLPNMDGVSALKKIRSDHRFVALPVILLTAKDSEVDKIVGLDNGADDYITKPFSVLELMARVRALLRRSEGSTRTTDGGKANKYIFNKLKINLDTREIFIDDKIVLFTFKEYEVLKYLIENKKRVVSRDELLNDVWGYKYSGETRTVDIHIRTMRQKLGEYGGMIKTVRGMGYRFNDEK